MTSYAERVAPGHGRVSRSLRTAALITAIALAVWLVMWVTHGLRQRQAIAALRAGDRELAVVYEFQLDRQGRKLANPDLPGPDWLRELIGIDFFAPVVELSASNLSAEARQNICRLADLRKLYLFDIDAQLSPDDVAALAALPHLVDLYLRIGGLGQLVNGADDRLLAGVARLTRLKVLSINLGPTATAGLAPLASLPSLRGLWLSAPESPIDSLAALAALRELETLSLTSFPNLSGPGTEFVSQLPALKSLSIADCPKLPLAQLPTAESLKSLAFFTDLPIRDEDLQQLASFAGLVFIDIAQGDRPTNSHAGFSAAGLMHLARLKELKRVTIDNPLAPPVSPAAIDDLKRQLPDTNFEIGLKPESRESGVSAPP